MLEMIELKMPKKLADYVTGTFDFTPHSMMADVLEGDRMNGSW